MSTSFANYSAFTIDDLYHPTLVEVYSIFGDVSLGVWKPVPLWPFYLGYSVGWYSNIPRELALLPLMGMNFFSVGMGFSLYIAGIHRYFQVIPLSCWYELYSYLPLRFCHYIVIFIIFECGICLPLWIFKPDNDELKEEALFKALFVEVSFGFCLLVIPITITTVLSICNVKWTSKFALITFMMVSTHAIAEYAIIIYFIKPYRMFFFQCIQKLIRPFGFKPSTVSANNFVQMTSTVPRGWKPVALWPCFLGYSVGWYSNIPKEYVLLPLVGITFFSVGMGFSIYSSVLHRYIQASPFSNWYKLYSCLPLRIGHYIVIFVLFECGLCIPLWMFKSDNNQLKDTIISHAEYMKFFFDKYPSVFGFAPELNGGLVIFVMASEIIVLVGIIILMVFLYVNFLRILKKNQTLLSVNTYRMQLILFKTLCIQIVLLFCLLIIPITSALSMALFQVKWVSKFALFMFMVTSAHAVAEFTTIIYFIKPYRLFCLQCIDKLTKALGIQVVPLPPNNIIQVSSTVLGN